MKILERIERVFRKYAPVASVNIDEIAESFEQYSEREIAGQIKRSCNSETRMWSGLGYWLENYAKSRAKTKVSVVDEIGAERERAEAAERRAEQPEEQPMSRDEIVAAARRTVESARKQGDDKWIKHHERRLENMLK